MGECRGDAADQVENQEPRVTQPVLDVVAEDVEREQVTEEMEPAAVQELRGKKRQSLAGEWRCQEPGRHHPKEPQDILPTLWRHPQLEEKDEHIDANQRCRDERELPGSDRILQRYHVSPLLRAVPGPETAEPMTGQPI